MEQGKETKAIKKFVRTETVSVAREILDSVRRGSQSREDINRINEEMYKSSEVFSILMRLMEKTCKPFKDGRTMKAVSEDSLCQNYVNQLIVDYKAEEKLPKQTVCLYAKGDVMHRLVSVETLETKKRVFEREPTLEELGKVQEEISKIKNRKQFIRSVEEIENPLEYYDLQFLGESIKYIKKPIKENDWLFGSLYTVGDSLLAINPELVVHQTLYPRLTSERISTGEFDGYGEPVELSVKLGKGLLESAYPSYVDYMLDKAANQVAKDARNTVINLVQIQCSSMAEEEKEAVVEAIVEKLTTRKSMSEDRGVGEYANAVASPAVVVTTMSGETGEIKAAQVGGDYDAGEMTDTKFYQTVMYGAFRAIKQEFGILDDNAGFSGGEALENIQSAEADMIQTAQKALCLLWEETFNRYLSRMGLDKFVGNFRLEMNRPHTKQDSEESESRESGVRQAEQVMNAVEGKEKPYLKLFRAMLGIVDLPEEAIQALDEIIDEGVEEEVEDEYDDYEGGGILDDLASEGYEDMGEVADSNIEDRRTERPTRERLPNFSEEDFEE